MCLTLRFSMRTASPLRHICHVSTALVLIVFLQASAAWAQVQRAAVIESGQGGGSTAGATSTVSGAGGLTDEPITPGQVVHVSVFNAPDFAVSTRVSEVGDIAYPYLGSVHIEGLNSAQASQLIADQLRAQNLVLDPRVLVTVDSFTTGVTVLGEVHSPGIYPLPGKQVLSDVIASAGGVTANTGRIIEISNPKKPGEKQQLPWDTTMHDTSSYDQPIHPGDRVLVRSCGIAYIGGHIAKPGAYSLCGSRQVTLSELVALAGDTTPHTSPRHIYLIRMQANGTRAAQEVDLTKVLRAKSGDPVINEDDIIYITPSTVKDVADRAVGLMLSMTTTLLYIYGNR